MGKVGRKAVFTAGEDTFIILGHTVVFVVALDVIDGANNELAVMT